MISGVKKENNFEEPEIIVREVKNAPTVYDKTPRVLLIDGDSIMYNSTYFPEEGIMEFPTEEEQLEEAKFRTRTKLQEIQNNIEEWYNIKETFIFVKGKNNFRYKIFPEYKANRKKTKKSPLLPFIFDYMVKELGAIPSTGAEADDFVINAVHMSKGKCVVSSIDKDVFYNSPDVPYYNYRSYNDVLGEFKSISKKESRLAIASQVVIGDSGDGIPGAYRIGKAWCKSNMNKDMTNYQFIKAILTAYLKANKGDFKESKIQIRKYYGVLKLYTEKELKNLNINDY